MGEWIRRWLGVFAVCFFVGCGGGGESSDVAGIEGFDDLDGSPLDPSVDADRDGLLDSLEQPPEGQERVIFVDTSGFGLDREFSTLERRNATSSTSMKDTDSDGLTDFEEYIIRTDPRSPDTDGDGLSDYMEWFKWYTSPVSVDTDGDAANNSPPNAFLFDGQELLGTRKGSTSPTLSDTDGDGKSDGEEIDHAFRSPLIADLPRVKLEIVGAPRIELFVEYAEAQAQNQSFSSTLSASTSEGFQSVSSRTQESHLNFSTSVTIGKSFGVKEGGASGKFEFKQGVDWGSSDAQTNGFTTSSVMTTQQQAARYWGQANTFTETASSGEIFLDMRVRNVGDSITFRLTQLGVAVRMLTRSATGEQPQYQTLAVLEPQGFESFTLAPGGATGEFTVSATGLNPVLVREFLSNPEALKFEVLYYDLENAEGINFAFLTENTFSQTAMLEIDMGEGEPQIVRVATNVRRSDPQPPPAYDAPGGADAPNNSNAGLFVGIPLKTALEEILGKDVQTTTRRISAGGVTKMVSVLEKLEDKGATQDVPPPVVQGVVTVAQNSREITVVSIDVGTALTEEGWEELWLGRTFVVDDHAPAYVIVEATAPDDGKLLLDREFEGVGGNVEFEVNDLFQAEPHVVPTDPSQPAEVESGLAQSFWIVMGTDGTQMHPHTDFEDIVLRAGDQVKLTFWEDKDGDNLSTRAEQIMGTTDRNVDCDGDGLGDSVETVRGWIAGAPAVHPVERAAFFEVVEAVRAGRTGPPAGSPPDVVAEFERLRAKIVLNDEIRGYPRWVHSVATTVDGDGDGLTDFFECIRGTDPRQPDTDGDGLLDKDDPFPIHPARILYVNQNWVQPLDEEGNLIPIPDLNDVARGLSWQSAYLELQDALAAARRRNGPKRDENGDLVDASDEVTSTPYFDPGDDIAEIWVAQGTYDVRGAPGGPFAAGERVQTFDLVEAVAVRGGFLGTERKLFERAADALLTAPTTLTNGDAGTHSHPIVRSGDLAHAVLDTVVVTGGDYSAGGAFSNGPNGSPTLTKVRFELNHASTGGAVFDEGAGTYDSCVFVGNTAAERGGAMLITGANVLLRDCRFENNSVPLLSTDQQTLAAGAFGTSDGGAVFCELGTVRFERCAFENNVGNRGAGIAMGSGEVLAKDCTFTGNNTSPASHPDFDFAHHNWVIGLTANSRDEIDSVLFPDGDPNTPYHTERGVSPEVEIGLFTNRIPFTGGLKNRMVETSGVAVVFTPGEIAAIGTKDGRAPEWEPPLSYIEGFESEMLPRRHQKRAGGAVFVTGGHLVLVQCVLYENRASVGGGVAFYGISTTVDMLNCTFAKNEAIGLGAAVYAPDFESAGSMVNTITSGQAEAFLSPPPVPEIRINETTQGTRKGGDPHTFYNLFYYDDTSDGDAAYNGGDLFWEQDPKKYHLDGWTSLRSWVYREPVIPTQVYIEGETFAFENNLLLDVPILKGAETDVDGLLGNVIGGNANGPEGFIAFEDIRFVTGLGLESFSNAVDAGKSGGIDYDPSMPGIQSAPETDIAGNPRRQNGRIDIGAYEFQPGD